MEDISSMSGKVLLNNLRKYEAYKNLTDYYIKKEIGGKKLATVDELKKELTKLSNQESKSLVKSPVKNIINTNENIQTQNIPDDVLQQTLLYSDLNTIINICTSNKNTMKLCNNEFWEAKLKYEDLPYASFNNNFNDWIKYYKLVLDTKREAEMMVKIVITFNKYKGYSYIRISDKSKHQHIYDGITLTYDQYKKEWYFGAVNKPLTHNFVINLLTRELMKDKMGLDITFTGDKDHKIAYHQLIKIKHHTEISKTYLAMYELLMDK